MADNASPALQPSAVRDHPHFSASAAPRSCSPPRQKPIPIDGPGHHALAPFLSLKAGSSLYNERGKQLAAGEARRLQGLMQPASPPVQPPVHCPSPWSYFTRDLVLFFGCCPTSRRLKLRGVSDRHVSQLLSGIATDFTTRGPLAWSVDPLWWRSRASRTCLSLYGFLPLAELPMRCFQTPFSSLFPPVVHRLPLTHPPRSAPPASAV